MSMLKVAAAREIKKGLADKIAERAEPVDLPVHPRNEAEAG